LGRFLPTYSPNLNLIEMMRSKVTASLRVAKALTYHDLITAVGHACEKSPPKTPSTGMPPAASH